MMHQHGILWPWCLVRNRVSVGHMPALHGMSWYPALSHDTVCFEISHALCSVPGSCLQHAHTSQVSPEGIRAAHTCGTHHRHSSALKSSCVKDFIPGTIDGGATEYTK